jgi:Na+/H+ antiporter NhaB
VQAGHTINLSAESTAPEFELAITKVSQKLSALSSANLDLSGKVSGYELAAKAASEKEITDLVDKAISDKCLSADQKTAFVELGRINLSALKVSLSAMKPVQTVEIPGAKEAVVVAGQETWTFDDFALKAPNELEKMQRTEPEKFQKLLSAKQQSVRATGTVAI